MKRYGWQTGFFAVLMIFAVRASAQEAQPRPERTFLDAVSVSAGVESLADTPLEHSGEVGVQRASFGGGATFSAGRGARLSFGLDVEKSTYDFSGVEPGVYPAEFEDMSATKLQANFFKVQSSKWSVFGIGTLKVEVEKGADASDGRTFGAVGGMRRQVNDRFGFSFGVLAKTRLENGPLIIPLPGFDWSITDRLMLRTGQGLTLSYQIDEMMRWKGEVSLGYEGREYRLDDEGGLPNGVLADRSIPCTLGVVYNPRPDIHVKLAMGSITWQEYIYKDSEGHSMKTDDPEMPTRYVSLDAGVKF